MEVTVLGRSDGSKAVSFSMTYELLRTKSGLSTNPHDLAQSLAPDGGSTYCE